MMQVDGNIPTLRDFDPTGISLDAQWAWKVIGGLDLDQAAKRFMENPDVYYEIFADIGPKAFVYYFPIMDLQS